MSENTRSPRCYPGLVTKAVMLFLLIPSLISMCSNGQAADRDHVFRLGHPIPIPATVDNASERDGLILLSCYSDRRSMLGATLIHNAINMRNRGSQTAVEVRLAFTFYDDFGYGTTHYDIAKIAAAPGSDIRNVNLSEWSDGPPPVRVTCAINSVRYK
jgi:hypothetical protein